MPFAISPRQVIASRPSVLLWVAITVLFTYERTYLIQKASLPHLLACVLVRVSLLLLLCYVHNTTLTRLLSARRYGQYVLFTGVSVALYLLMQGLYDQYLFGFIIGDRERAGFGQNLPYNALATGWYLLLTYLVKRAVESADPPTSAAQSDKQAESQLLTVKTGTRWIRLPVDEVLYAQGLKDYTLLFTPHERYVLKGSIGTVAGQLPVGLFVRVHKSYLVARQHIRSVSGTEVTVPGHSIPVGRVYTKIVLDEFTSQVSSNLTR